MKKSDYDQIIINKNEKMAEIIMWYQDNQKWLDDEEFYAPLENGCIVMKEEDLDIIFESKGDIVEISVYFDYLDRKIFSYDYDPKTHKCSNHRYQADISQERREKLKKLLQIDYMDVKEAIKYHSLMKFAAHYKENIIVDESKNVTRTKHEAKKLRKNANQPLPLVRKTYIVYDFDAKELKECKEKRGYTKPDREVSVRGFYRRSKTGKKSWVKPFTRYRKSGTASRRNVYKV